MLPQLAHQKGLPPRQYCRGAVVSLASSWSLGSAIPSTIDRTDDISNADSGNTASSGICFDGSSLEGLLDSGIMAETTPHRGIET